MKLNGKVTYTHDDRDYRVVFSIYPGHPGTRYRRNGDPGDPPEPAELNIVRVTAVETEEDVTATIGPVLECDDNFAELAWATCEDANSPEER